MVGLVGSWIDWKYNQLSPKLGWVGSLTELGNFMTHVIFHKFEGTLRPNESTEILLADVIQSLFSNTSQ